MQLPTVDGVNTEDLLRYNKILITRAALSRDRRPHCAPDRHRAAVTTETSAAEAMNEPFDIIQTVRLTEKATLLSEKENKYVFQVSPRANKIQIKAAVEALIKKKVVAVNTMQLRRQEQARKRARRRPQAALEKGHRHPGRRREDRLRLTLSGFLDRINRILQN